jgi:hypothetical protein
MFEHLENGAIDASRLRQFPWMLGPTDLIIGKGLTHAMAGNQIKPIS